MNLPPNQNICIIVMPTTFSSKHTGITTLLCHGAGVRQLDPLALGRRQHHRSSGQTPLIMCGKAVKRERREHEPSVSD